MRTSPARMRNLVISAFVIAATVLASACAAATDQEIDRRLRARQAGIAPGCSPYQDWVARFQEKDAVARFDKDQVALRAVITEVHGDDKIGSPEPADVLEDPLSYGGCRVSVDGRVVYFHVDWFSIKGSGCPKIANQDFQRLNTLLKELPDDGSRLPPSGRRMMIQVWDGDKSIERVYDLANAPEKVHDILRLSLCAMKSYVPEFKPEKEWTVYPGDGPGEGALILSPDGGMILSSSDHGPIKMWDSDTYKPIDEAGVANNWSVQEITYVPNRPIVLVKSSGDYVLIDTRTWLSFGRLAEPLIGRRQEQLSRPQFTSDGRYLLLETTKPELKVYDTKTWEPAPMLPGIPKDAITYIVPPKGANTVYVTKDGTLKIWDAKKQKDIATLDTATVLIRAAFSPDKSLIAAATMPKDPSGYSPHKQVRVWNLKTGKPVNELKPFERPICEEVEGLLWSPDGKYLLAAVKYDGFWTSRGVAIWNLKSGRHRGELEGPIDYVTGMAFTKGAHRLIVGCCDGKIRVWDVDRAFKEIAAFEKSLGEKL